MTISIIEILQPFMFVCGVLTIVAIVGRRFFDAVYYTGDYQAKIRKSEQYNLGLMVPHYSLIVTLSIVGILISLIIQEVLQLS